jgi:FMN-dependent oxidoreductase (nitrilotriacetate monooxygenase family)
MFHLGWFVGKGYSVHAWGPPWAGELDADWPHADLYLDLARSMERSCFDYLMIEDGSLVPDAYQGRMDWYLRNAFTAPKSDPMPLVPLIGQVTRHVGIVATMTTAFYPPYLAARLAATLDHLTRGRFGLNLVTAHNDRTAQNFGLDRHQEHDLRYRMADEWVDLVDQLWNSWEPGAVVADRAGGVYTDPSKVHEINFAGQFYKSRGPLNMPPGPQRRPVICQAGGSPAGRAFAARHADTIVARNRGVAAARAFRADISERMRGFGRASADCKVMHCASITLGETIDEARERQRRHEAALAADIETRLAAFSFYTMQDFSRFDLDAPLPELTTNASRTMIESYTAGSAGKTLREILTDPASGTIDFVGTPDSVAAAMGEAMAEIGGDGFMVTEPLTRHGIAEITDGLAPALRRRRLVRDGYAGTLFRDNLLAF